MTPYRLYRCRVDGVVELGPAQATVVIQHGVHPSQVRWWLQFVCPGCGNHGDLKPVNRPTSNKWRNAGAAVVVLEYPAEVHDVRRGAWFPSITAEEITDMGIDLADDVWLRLAVDKLTSRYGGLL